MTQPATISVRGAGNVSVAPDMTVVAFQMSALDRVYARSVETLNKRVAALRDAVAGAGNDRADLKTTRFTVDADYTFEDSRRIFNGWKARHELRLELPVDREHLNRVLEAVTASKADSELTIRFEVRDQATLRTRVLDDATRTARRNADAIATAASCRLGKVVNIEYGWSEVRFGSMSFAMQERITAIDAIPDIEPEDIDAKDTVTVVWELLEG